MTNKQLLQSICTALMLTESDVNSLMGLAGLTAPAAASGLLDDCSNEQLRFLLEGLIIAERGPRDDGKAPAVETTALSNNEVLKKLRIAFNLQQDDMLLIFEEGGAELSRTEFGALFRKADNKHFRACSDELLLQFLSGFQPKLDT